MASGNASAVERDLHEQEMECRVELHHAVEALRSFRRLCGVFAGAGQTARAEAETLQQQGQQLEERFAELVYRLQRFCAAADSFLLEQAGQRGPAAELRNAVDGLWLMWRSRPALCAELLERIRNSNGGPWIDLGDWPGRYGRKAEQVLECCQALTVPLENLCNEYARVCGKLDDNLYMMELYGAPPEPVRPRENAPEKAGERKKTLPRPKAPYPACHEDPEPIEKPMTILYGPPEVFGLDPEQKARGPAMESVYAAPPRMETMAEKRRPTIFGRDKTKK